MQINRNQFIKFLVASDNHLGANENVGPKSNRYQDAFEAFEEVLQIATQQNVDFVILGGDLFHEKHPTEHCLLKCVDILQRHVFGDNFGGIQMELNSLNYQPNFSCSNFNIQLPIFIINGNHDDIVTERNESVSILDILHESKYLNYIGKITDQSYVCIKPIVLVKNNQKIALYGLGYMKDYQLHKIINDGKLVLESLNENNFNILIIHQNKYKGNHFQDEKNFIDPIYFKNYKIDLLIWGHEHEAIYTLDTCEHFQVFYPGSTVATSIIEYESLIKQAGLFTLTQNQMKFESIKLEKSYRPMIYKNIELNELIKISDNNLKISNQELAEKLLFDFVEKELINYYQTSQYRQKKPLLRIKVEYSGFELMRMRYIETKFADRVSNPDQIFKFWEKKSNLQAQIQKRIEQAQLLNQQFDNILRNKVDINSQNQTMMNDFTNMLSQKLYQQNFQIIEQGDFLNILDNFLSSTNKEKSNLFNDLYPKTIEKFKEKIIPQYNNRILQIVKKQREHQESIIFLIRDAIIKNFEGKTKQESLYCTDFANDISQIFIKFQEDFRIESSRASINQTNKLNNNSLQIMPSKQIQQSKQQENSQLGPFLIEEDDTFPRYGQTQASLFDQDQQEEEEEEEKKDNKGKKGAKKRKPMKKDQDVVNLDNQQKQRIQLQPYKIGMNKFF
ncbi:unnamed protein product [Paramecium pentaurelia]|uniref:Mre11 DNA-binding domain-containing protein n=1 Tax=Paramecium pentaurelia TaxID=43138 RepID=A0A8S1WCW6_9CILI|nr:unnamed protein product [Paramecium pentaurelia]